MKKVLALIGGTAVGAVSFLAPFTAVNAGADFERLYTHPLVTAGVVTGETTRFADTVVSGTVGVIGGVDCNVNHTINAVDLNNSSSGLAVIETNYSSSQYYSLRSQTPYNWYSTNIISSGFTYLDNLRGVGRGSFDDIALDIVTYGYTPVGAFVVDIVTACTVVHMATGESVAFNVYNSLYRYGGASGARVYLEFSPIDDYLSDMSYGFDTVYYSFNTSFTCYDTDSSVDIEYAFTLNIPRENLLMLDSDGFLNYIPEDAQFAGVMNSIFLTIENFLKIELLPHFHIYDVIAIVLGVTLLGFALKFFLGG